MYILLLAAAVVRGQLDGLRSRIRFPPQWPGRHVVYSRAVPYLDWWALANAADIVVRRHAGCIPQASTFSTTARAWGLDVERAARRARPDFDGLV